MTREEAYTAIRKADAAGDSASAQKLAAYIQALPPDEEEGGLAVDVAYTGDEGVDPSVIAEQQDDSALTGFVGGLIKPIDNIVRGLEQIPGVADANKAVSEFLGMDSGAEAVAANDAMRANNSRTGYQLLGNIAGTLPTAALPGGVLAQGAAGGALLSDANNLTDLGKDTILGAAGGYAGDKLLRGGASLIAPQLNSALRTLVDAGVKVTPGQLARSSGGRGASFLARSEDRALSTPFVGDRIAAARNNSLDTFSRATVNRALEPIGGALPADIRGRRAVQYAGDQLSDAYDEVLPRLTATGDAQFLDDLAAIGQEAQTMLPARLEQYNNILGGLNRFWQDGVNLDGRALKEIETRIGERVRRAAMSTDADQRELGDRLGDVLASVRDLAARQNPAEAEALSAINRGWRSLTQVERAAGNSRGQVSPAGYSQSVKQSSDTVRRRGYARGEALNQDLADAASDILPSEIADSGTAGRWQQSNIPAMLLGAAQLPGYAAAQGATNLLTRDSLTSPALSQLVRALAPLLAAPVGGPLLPAGATATIHALSD